MFLAAMFLSFSGVMHAQQQPAAVYTPAQDFYFGLKATPTFYWGSIDDDNVESDGARVGFTYGLMMDFHIDRSYFFATGIDISNRGFKAKGGETEVIQRLKYIDIPVALKLKTKEIGYITYYGLFGMLPGFLISANQDVDAPGDADDRTKRNNQSDFSPFNAGILVGLGIEYNIGGSTYLTGGVSYNNGFTDTYEPDEGDMKITSNQISLNIGVYF